MTKLDCSVVSCLYNTDSLCSKGDIMVDGSSAKVSDDTCCSSFKERKECGCSNAACHPKKEIHVDCQAQNCVFNEERRCSADHIGIAGGNACQCMDTECSSFTCK